MNEWAFKIETVASVGVHAKFRTAKDGELKPILGVGGTPKVYRSTGEAALDLLDHLMRYINGHMVREGEIAGATMDEAESVFKAPLRQKGKTRVITVDYKGQKRRCAKLNKQNRGSL